MKLMIASDIHGSALYCEKLLSAYEQENPEKLLLLGDILYHGPRNDLPADYDPKAVFRLLNGAKKEILCVRGNCDAEVDQMVLEFPITADCMLLDLAGRAAFVTHGHVFNLSSLPPLKDGDLLIHGHTHVLTVQQKAGITYINPGSAALPKEGNPKSYMVWEDGLFSIKELDGTVITAYDSRI